ncbi:hypothetical protein DPMN_092171 [Dreissena polymorpha]|uniref:Uncharacterized protein n=1 Tax=Dreissena polymorpha TaxID=45954 RepID=A0A9D4R0Q4_DREPO|nr:hypothetical protein DPMN_092171 [Dreissena polymorpha]
MKVQGHHMDAHGRVFLINGVHELTGKWKWICDKWGFNHVRHGPSQTFYKDLVVALHCKTA